MLAAEQCAIVRQGYLWGAYTARVAHDTSCSLPQSPAAGLWAESFGAMLKSQIKVRHEYAFREKRRPGEPIQRVRIVEHVRGNKWKAEWIEPNPGLADYVESG